MLECSPEHLFKYRSANPAESGLESNASKHSIRGASGDWLSDMKSKANSKNSNAEYTGKNNEPTSTVAKRSHETHEAVMPADPQLPGHWV